MGNKKFTRTVEDFVCEKCNFDTKGTGYTNHCSACLWSKHVDVHPGDRKAECKGLMEPIEVEKKGEEFILTHKCVVCGHEKRNKTAPNDDIEKIIELSIKK